MRNLLVIVDMQNDFIDGVLGTPEAQAIVPKICDLIRNWNGDIAITYDTHDSNYLNTMEGNYLPISHCIKGTQGWYLNKQIENAVSEKNFLILKIEKDTFGSLELALKVYTYDSITIVGVCTDICVITNATVLKTVRPNTVIKVLADCCAGTTPQAHQAALTVMKNCQIEVIE